MGNTWIVGTFIFGYFLIVILIFTLSMSSIDRDLRNRRGKGSRFIPESSEVYPPEMIEKQIDLPEASLPFSPSFSTRRTLVIASGVSSAVDGEAP